MKEFSACAKRGFVALLVFAMPLMLQAAEVAEVAEKSLTASDPMSSIGRVALTLVAMIGFILLLAYGAKRLQNMTAAGRGGLAPKGQAIKTLATISLGLKEKVSLLQVGEQQLLVGITAHSIQTLLVLDEPISPNDIDQQAPVFQAILKKALNKQ